MKVLFNVLFYIPNKKRDMKKLLFCGLVCGILASPRTFAAQVFFEKPPMFSAVDSVPTETANAPKTSGIVRFFQKSNEKLHQKQENRWRNPSFKKAWPLVLWGLLSLLAAAICAGFSVGAYILQYCGTNCHHNQIPAVVTFAVLAAGFLTLSFVCFVKAITFRKRKRRREQG